MDEQRQRIIEDLSGLLEGELRCDPLTLTMYSSDASLYQQQPLAVATPRCEADVVTLAQYAAHMDIPLIPRGAGTGLAGGALGQGLVIDFSRHMSRIEHIGSETVRVQPGVVLSRLNHVLREHGRYFPPDPSNANVTTIGGMLAVDAAGSRSVRVGSMRDHVQSINTVLADGTALEFGVESLDILKQPPTRPGDTGLDGLEPPADSRDVKRTLISKLAKLISDNAELIRKHQAASLVRNMSGYYLRQVLTAQALHVPRLLVGSEGTLAIFTGATLHTAPLPVHRGIVLLLFGQLESAVRAVQSLAPLQVSACDLMDRRLLSLAREADPQFARTISPVAEAALIVEQSGFSNVQIRDRIRMVIEAVRARDPQVLVAREGYTFEDVEALWSLPRLIVPILTRLKGQTRPLPFVEDIAVPPEALHDFLVQAQKVFQKHEVTASLYAHAAAGQLHLRPFLPQPSPEDGMRIEAICSDLYEVVREFGGSISGEHGDGLVRSSFVARQYGELYRVFREIKKFFDPHNLLNPGKIITSDPHQTQRHLRPRLEPPADATSCQLNWEPLEVLESAARCNGCGVCKTQEREHRMCPFFRVDSVEDASPRAKANVLRNLGSQLTMDDFRSPEMKQLAGLCFNCKQCELECPANVNIPQLMIEAKASYVAMNGLSRADWILSRAHSFGALASSVAWLSNWALSNPAARWLIEKTIGISRQRKLPRFARRTFLRSAPRRLTQTVDRSQRPRPVIYFVDHFANYHDPQLARAFVAILDHNSIPVHVPPDQTASGMAMISAGDLDAARELAEHNIRILADFARDGYDIVCTEPAAALCLSKEYPMLVDHPDVPVIARQVLDAGEFLLKAHEEGRLQTDFSPLDLDVAYHTPCHLKSLSPRRPLFRLLSLIPDLRVHTIERGCSGMAGAFGLVRDNFRTSIRIGWGLISAMREESLDVGATECSSCKLQMEQGSVTPTLHPLKLLALSYGLMPDIAEKLKPAPRRLVSS